MELVCFRMPIAFQAIRHAAPAYCLSGNTASASAYCLSAIRPIYPRGLMSTVARSHVVSTVARSPIVSTVARSPVIGTATTRISLVLARTRKSF